MLATKDDIEKFKANFKKRKPKSTIVYPEFLHEFIGNEAEEYRKFRDKHYKKCHNSGTYIVRLTGTGIGEGIEVTCPKCGQTKDITDISKW